MLNLVFVSSAGIFAGCSIAFLVAYIVFLRLHGLKMIHEQADVENSIYMGSYFPVFRLVDFLSSLYTVIMSCKSSISTRVVDQQWWCCSLLSLIVLHLYMYGWNLYIWREKRINFAFIFEFSPNTVIKYREMLLIASGLATLVLGGLLGQIMAYTSLITSFNAKIVPILLLSVYFKFILT